MQIEKVNDLKGFESYKITYYVDMLDDDWRCDCDGFRFRKKCHHITAVKEYRKLYKRVDNVKEGNVLSEKEMRERIKENG